MFNRFSPYVCSETNVSDEKSQLLYSKNFSLSFHSSASHLPADNYFALKSHLNNQSSDFNSPASLAPSSQMIDLNNDAGLLEASTKRNDKYTVRRILDVHFSHFRVRNGSAAQSANEFNPLQEFNSRYAEIRPADLPSIFFSILHLAIEHDSMDVLRICLKHGLNPNEPGQHGVNSKKSVRFPVDCKYCSKKFPTVNGKKKMNYLISIGTQSR